MRKRKWYERMSAAVLIAVLLVNHGDMGIMANAETITALEENLEKAKELEEELLALRENRTVCRSRFLILQKQKTAQKRHWYR